MTVVVGRVAGRCASWHSRWCLSALAACLHTILLHYPPVCTVLTKCCGSCTVLHLPARVSVHARIVVCTSCKATSKYESGTIPVGKQKAAYLPSSSPTNERNLFRCFYQSLLLPGACPKPLSGMVSLGNACLRRESHHPSAARTYVCAPEMCSNGLADSDGSDSGPVGCCCAHILEHFLPTFFFSVAHVHLSP